MQPFEQRALCNVFTSTVILMRFRQAKPRQVFALARSGNHAHSVLFYALSHSNDVYHDGLRISMHETARHSSKTRATPADPSSLTSLTTSSFTITNSPFIDILQILKLNGLARLVYEQMKLTYQESRLSPQPNYYP
jgi:hypothetical protein